MVSKTFSQKVGLHILHLQKETVRKIERQGNATSFFVNKLVQGFFFGTDIIKSSADITKSSTDITKSSADITKSRTDITKDQVVAPLELVTLVPDLEM